MPISIVAGGQFGSEGKGKVALYLARRREAHAAVRVGGPNSGHTVVSSSGARVVLRQLPTAALLPNPLLILPPGSYIEPEVLLAEVNRLGVTPDRLLVDPNAVIVTAGDKATERSNNLPSRIGSTGSGTGAAVVRRIMRDDKLLQARDIPELAPFLADTLSTCSRLLDLGSRIVLEGTQGFGLSVLHGGHGSFSTSRDTTAAGVLSEVGLSPLSVDEVAMVIRTFPIRVAGNSGPLPKEVTWEAVAECAGRPGLSERTTVTNKVRRVAQFDGAIVRRAIAANRPSLLALNHVDYLAPLRHERFSDIARQFVESVELEIGRDVDLLGLSADALIPREDLLLRSAQHRVASTP